MSVALGAQPPTAEDDVPLTSRRSRSGLLATVGVVGVYVALAIFVFDRVWGGHPTSDMQLGGDQWRNVWFLAWVPHALAHGLNPLFSGYANVPVGVNLLSGAGVPLLGLLFAPITALWGPVATYNVVSTAALALSAIAGYVLLRRLTTWRLAAFFGGLLYGFSPSIIAQADGHINLSFVPLPPLILLVCHEIVVGNRGRGPARLGLVLGALVTAQFFVSSEILLDTALVAVIAVALAALAGRDAIVRRFRPALVGFAWAVALAMVLLAWPIWFMLAGSAHVSGKLNLVPQAYRADLLGPFMPNRNELFTIHGTLLARANQFASGVSENGSYLGIPLIVLLTVGVVMLRRHRTVVVVALAGAAAFILSLGGALTVSGLPALGPNGTAGGQLRLPETVLAHLPVLDNVEPVRFSLLVDLLAAVLLAYVLEGLHHALTPRNRNVTRWARLPRPGLLVPAVAGVVALAPLIPAVPLGGIGFNGTPPLFSSQAIQTIPNGSTALIFPFPSGAFPQPPLWQAEARFRFKMAGGGYLVPEGPSNHIAYSPELSYAADSLTGRTLTSIAHGFSVPQTDSLRVAMLYELHAWNVTGAIATPAAGQDPQLAEDFLQWLLGPPQLNLQGSLVWHRIDSER